MVALPEVAGPEHHVAVPAGAVVVEHTVVVPKIGVPVPSSFLARDHDDDRRLNRREDAALRLGARRTVLR